MDEIAAVRHRIRVTGTVQGVGFRPFVYRHATELGLFGWVRNDSAGVLIEVEGAEQSVAEFCRLVADEPPPLARVRSVCAEPISVTGDDHFAIVESASIGPPTAPISIDSATCAACVREIANPTDRRYRYPFTNCTDCGPRYTIVQSVPYDRPATTMAAFTMCAACQSEYDDPADRRFTPNRTLARSADHNSYGPKRPTAEALRADMPTSGRSVVTVHLMLRFVHSATGESWR